MDMLNKLSREAQIVLGGALLALIFSFFDWQQVSAFGVSAGKSEWGGVGVIAGLLIIALLLWEVARLFELRIQLGPLTPGLVSVGLALLLLLFTLITFLTHNEFRHWPAWVGFILSIVIAAAAVVRAKGEGVQMPDMSAMTSRPAGDTTAGTTTPPPPPPPPAETPP